VPKSLPLAPPFAQSNPLPDAAQPTPLTPPSVRVHLAGPLSRDSFATLASLATFTATASSRSEPGCSPVPPYAVSFTFRVTLHACVVLVSPMTAEPTVHTTPMPGNDPAKAAGVPSTRRVATSTNVGVRPPVPGHASPNGGRIPLGAPCRPNRRERYVTSHG